MRNTLFSHALSRLKISHLVACFSITLVLYTALLWLFFEGHLIHTLCNEAERFFQTLSSVCHLFVQQYRGSLMSLSLNAVGFFSLLLIVRMRERLKEATRIIDLFLIAEYNVHAFASDMLARSRVTLTNAFRLTSDKLLSPELIVDKQALLGVPHITYFSFQEALTRVLSLLNPLAWVNGNEIQRQKNQKKPCFLYADRLMIELILAHLLETRLHYLPRAHFLYITLRLTRQFLVVSITDNGKPEEESRTPSAHIFSLSKEEFEIICLKASVSVTPCKKKNFLQCTVLQIPLDGRCPPPSNPRWPSNVIPFPNRK